ncbi:MAG: dTDP-4-dehydrorhamnose reductase [Elusimicrobia bacterium]|nr:MAG: dTDP-4-dehydrorhamnose reductase [Elusimicrobiota bacterium]
MRILLFGKHGQVGWELQRSLAPLGEITVLGSRVENGLCGDFRDLAGLAACVRQLAPDVIVNAAAYTAVDRAESERELANTINSLAPAVLAEEADRRQAWLVHYSTDYVFDGSGDRPWREDDVPAPLGVYGRSKLAGERAVIERCPRHLIFRTSWVYAARGANFLRTLLRLANERDRLQIVADQVGAPTGADLIADITAHALRCVVRQSSLAGVYHLAASGETSWHGYAGYLIDHARRLGQPVRVADAAIDAIPTAQYPTPARRPLNSRLDTHKLRVSFDLSLPAWQTGVERALRELCER